MQPEEQDDPDRRRMSTDAFISSARLIKGGFVFGLSIAGL